MSLKYVDPKKIKVPPIRVTSVWDQEDYEVFKSSLAANGIVNPIICIFDGKEWWLADGKHRLDEALLKGETRVPVAYREGSLIDAKIRNLFLNRMRGKTKVSEEVALVKDLYENDGLDLAEISRRTGIPQELVEKRLAISRADPYVQEMLDAEKIGVGIAFELSRLPNPKGQIRLLQELVKMPKLPDTKWVHEIVDESLRLIEERSKAPDREPVGPPLRTIRCGFCDQRYEEGEIRGINLCMTCLGLAKDHIRELMKKRAEGTTPEQIIAKKVTEET